MEERLMNLLETYDLEEIDAINYIVSYYMQNKDVEKAIDKLKDYKLYDYGYYLHILSTLYISLHLKYILKHEIFYTYIKTLF